MAIKRNGLGWSNLLKQSIKMTSSFVCILIIIFFLCVCVCVWPSPSHSGRFLLKGLDFDVSDRYNVVYRMFSDFYLRIPPLPPFGSRFSPRRPLPA